MNRSLIAVTVAVVLLLLFGACILSAGQYFSNGCFWWECAPVRNFNVRDWEIPISLFPSGAFTDHISIPTDNMVGEIEGGLQSIYLDQDGLAVYDIYRFPRVKDAISQFEHDKRDMVDPATGEVWDIPSGLTFSSTSANDVYYACGYFQVYRCEMAARYQEYTLFFGMTITDKMTYDVFENVLIYLDEQISSRLYP